MIVTNKIAKLARKKGFKEYCTAYFCHKTGNLMKDNVFKSQNVYDHNIAAPDIYILMRWLEEFHGIYIMPEKLPFIEKNEERSWMVKLGVMENLKWKKKEVFYGLNYEHAVMNTIPHALNLIENVI